MALVPFQNLFPLIGSLWINKIRSTCSFSERGALFPSHGLQRRKKNVEQIICFSLLNSLLNGIKSLLRSISPIRIYTIPAHFERCVDSLWYRDGHILFVCLLVMMIRWFWTMMIWTFFFKRQVQRLLNIISKHLVGCFSILPLYVFCHVWAIPSRPSVQNSVGLMIGYLD